MGDRYDFKYFRTELREPGILRVTLDRPERRNAITPEMHSEFAPLFSRIAEDRTFNNTDCGHRDHESDDQPCDAITGECGT